MFIDLYNRNAGYDERPGEGILALLAVYIGIGTAKSESFISVILSIITGVSSDFRLSQVQGNCADVYVIEKVESYLNELYREDAEQIFGKL